GAKVLWDALMQALSEFDLARLTKMPATVEDRLNPLVLLPLVKPSPLSNHLITIDAEWTEYWHSLHRTFRNQLGRHWRTFISQKGAAFKYVESGMEASRILAQLESQQSARLRRLGKPYRLDKPEFAAFYRQVTAAGLSTADIVLTALIQDSEVVSALLG